MSNLFTNAQIQVLKEEFGKLNTVHPDRLPDFHKMFDKMDDNQLLQVARAQIKFLSKLAVNACVRRGLEIFTKN